MHYCSVEVLLLPLAFHSVVLINTITLHVVTPFPVFKAFVGLHRSPSSATTAQERCFGFGLWKLSDIQNVVQKSQRLIKNKNLKQLQIHFEQTAGFQQAASCNMRPHVLNFALFVELMV